MHILQLHAKMCNKLIRKLTSIHSSYWCCLHRPCFDLCLKLTNFSLCSAVYCSCSPSFLVSLVCKEQKLLCEFQFVILIYLNCGQLCLIFCLLCCYCRFSNLSGVFLLNPFLTNLQKHHPCQMFQWAQI